MAMKEDYIANDFNYLKAMLNLSGGRVVGNLYEMVCQHPDLFKQKGITPALAKEIVDLKSIISFCPEPSSYSIKEQERVDYIYENLDNPSIVFSSENEKRFMDAILSYYAARDEYDEKVRELKELVNDERSFPKNDAMAEEKEIGILMDILFDRFSVDSSQEPYSVISTTFKKCDLIDAYNMDDDGQALKLKAGLVLESKGLLSQGLIDKIVSDAGYSVDAIKAALNRYKIDRMRVWNVKTSPLDTGLGELICCEIDGVAQEARVLSADVVKRKNLLTDEKGLAIRLFKDVLDNTREKSQWLNEEKILKRVSMPYLGRLLDIYRNGMTKEDILLMNKVVDTQQTVDSFWEDNNFGPDEFSVEQQKELAFSKLVNYLSDIRPDMLSAEEILRLIEVVPMGCLEEEIPERNLLRLDESFFPLVEQSGEYDYLLDYVKTVKGMERITPKLAFNSMDYYLYHLSDEVWDPEGVDDECGRVTGGYVRKNCFLSNPAYKFPPNLLSEEQWKELKARNPEVTNKDLPSGAFKRNRVTDVQVYPYRDGSMAIRCKVDNEQQESRLLSETDMRNYSDNTDRRELAVNYYMDAFAREPERNIILGR